MIKSFYMLDPQVEVQLYDTIKKFINTSEFDVFIFGSWAAGTNRKYSDIDVGITGPNPIKGHIIQNIKGEFEESDLPYKVDVVDFSTLTDQFKSVAMQHQKPLGQSK